MNVLHSHGTAQSALKDSNQLGLPNSSLEFFTPTKQIFGIEDIF
jgi:hypothetical protein